MTKASLKAVSIFVRVCASVGWCALWSGRGVRGSEDAAVVWSENSIRQDPPAAMRVVSTDIANVGRRSRVGVQLVR